MRSSSLTQTGWRTSGAALLLMAAISGAAFAGKIGVSVSSVQVSPGVIYPGQQATVSYTLAGSGITAGALKEVDVQFIDAANVVKKSVVYPAGQPGAKVGPNSVAIDQAVVPAGGPYTVKVVAVVNPTLTLSSTYTDVSDPANPSLHFLNPRGVDVNRITGSPYYGRVYVTEGMGGQTSARTTVDGVYVFNPDLSDAFPGPRATSADMTTAFGGPWGGTENSPFRPYVGPDGNLYINDSSDGHSGLFVTDGDVSPTSLKSVFPVPDGTTYVRDNFGTVTGPNGTLYGSTSSTWIEGTGASRVMYNTVEDIPVPDSGKGYVRYDLGTSAFPYDKPPTILPPFTANWYADNVRDSQGNAYLVSLAADDASKYDKDGNRVADLPGSGASYEGIAIDEGRNMILLATNQGKIIKTDKSFSASTDLITGLGTNVRDVAIDGEGWIWAVDSTDELLHAFVPAGTFTPTGSNASASTTLTVVSNPVPGDVAPVGTGGLFTGPNGHKYGDGKVTLQDAVAVLRIAAGLDMVP